MARVSCILPVYNEGESLPLTVAEWADSLARCTRDYEIIAVDDGSTDDTPRQLRELRARHERLRVITHERNLGYGAAITNGFTAATFPLLFFTDSDGQYDPADLDAMLAHMDGADVAVGYRRRRADPEIRDLLSRGYNLLVRRVLGVHLRDINCAFKMMHRDAFRSLGIESTGFAINAELALSALAADLVLVELPVSHRPRHAGRSKVRPFHIVRAIQGLAWLRRRRGRVGAAVRSAGGHRAFVPESLPLERGRDGAASAH
jgi:dolichol-phosphate mannosyltransferase